MVGESFKQLFFLRCYHSVILTVKMRNDNICVGCELVVILLDVYMQIR